MPQHRHHKTSKSAGVIIVDPWTGGTPYDPSSHRIMVVQQKYSGVWGLPKGHLEDDNENVCLAAHRELSEETGLHLSHLTKGRDYLVLPLHAERVHDEDDGDDEQKDDSTNDDDTINDTTNDTTNTEQTLVSAPEDATIVAPPAPPPPSTYPHHVQLKKIHFFVYVLLRQGATLAHTAHDTKEIAAISWMNVYRWAIDERPQRYETRIDATGKLTVVPVVHDLHNGAKHAGAPPAPPTTSRRKPQPPRFNRTLADTSVLALKRVCKKTATHLQGLYGRGVVAEECVGGVNLF